MAYVSHAGASTRKSIQLLKARRQKTDKLLASRAKKTGRVLKSGKSRAKHSECYNSSYVGIVLRIINRLGLVPIEETMTDESELMEVTDKIQKCLQNIQSFYQKIENESESGGCWIQFHHHDQDFIGPNAYDGLKKGYYYQTLDHNTAQGSMGSAENNAPNTNYYGSEQISSGYQSDMKGFIQDIKTLFQCGTITGKDAVPASELESFSVKRLDSNGNDATITVDMSSTYAKLESGPFADFVKKGVQSFVDPKAQPNTSASLIMQYVYDKAKVATDTLGLQDLFNMATQDPKDPSQWFISDASQIISFDPSKGGGDGVLRMQYNLLNDLDTQVQVSRSTYYFPSFNGTTTPNILALIFDKNGPDYYEGDYDLKNKTGAFLQHYGGMGDNTYAPNQCMGLYGAFSYLAFNYFWTKNPSSAINNDIKAYPMDWQNPQYKDPNYENNGFWTPDGCWGYAPGWNQAPNSGDSGHYGDLFGHPTANKLGILVNDTQSSTSIISSSNNETSTTMQEMTSEHSTLVNIAQNTIKGNSENLNVAVKNNDG